MPSRPLIGRAVLLLGVALVAYATLLQVAWDRVPKAAESQWSNNLMHAQQYVYDRRDVPVVVVGSSLFNQVPQRDLPPDAFKLAMSGMTAYDGLDIVLDAGTAPALVLVETNVLDKAGSERLRESLFARGLYGLKARLRFLREEGRPLAILGTKLVAVVDKAFRVLGLRRSGHLLAASTEAGPDGADPEGAARRRAVAEELLALRLARWDGEPDPARLRDVSDRLHARLDALRARGTRVVFFEMPTDPRLCGNRFIRATRGLITAEWPTAPVLTAPPCDAFRTSDGLHLTRPDAVRYARLLVNELHARGLWPTS